MSPEAANLQVRTRREDPAARGRRASPLALPDASGVPAPAASPAVAYDTVLVILLGIALGATLAAVVLPLLLPDLAGSLRGAQPKAFWYLSRAFGVAAYLLLWLSTVLGLTITNRFARLWGRGPVIASVHQFVSLHALALVFVHAALLLGDRYTNYRLDHLLVPFTASPHEPFWVGLGQVAAYVALPVTFSFYVRQFIGVRCWRHIHYASFLVYWLAAAHGVGAGTDSATPVMAAVYAGTASAVVFLTVHRVVAAVGQRLSASPSPRAIEP